MTAIAQVRMSMKYYIKLINLKCLTCNIDQSSNTEVMHSGNSCNITKHNFHITNNFFLIGTYHKYLCRSMQNYSFQPTMNNLNVKEQ